jgi:hypothetical protein
MSVVIVLYALVELAEALAFMFSYGNLTPADEFPKPFNPEEEFKRQSELLIKVVFDEFPASEPCKEVGFAKFGIE